MQAEPARDPALPKPVVVAAQLAIFIGVVSEVLGELRKGEAHGFLLVTSERNEERQLRRWRRHLDDAGRDLPLLLFSLSGSQNVAHCDETLAAAGADRVARRLDKLIKCTETCLPMPAAPHNNEPPKASRPADAHQKPRPDDDPNPNQPPLTNPA